MGGISLIEWIGAWAENGSAWCMRKTLLKSLSATLLIVNASFGLVSTNQAPSPLDIPQDGVAKGVGPATIALSWSDRSLQETGYEVEWISGSVWTPLVTLPKDSTHYYHRGLGEESTHEYRVRAVDGTSQSEWLSLGTGTTTIKMNLIFFFADDMGYKDIVGLRHPAVDGPTLHETPNLDQLISESTVITNAYCSGPRCVVSRRSILTGNYDWRPEVVGNANNYLDPETNQKTSGGIPGEVPTFGSPLQAGGFRTCFIGKYHLGASDDVPQNGVAARGPANQGFDIEIGAGHEGAPPNSYFALADPDSPGSFTYELHGSEMDSVEFMLPAEAAVTQEDEYLTDRMTKKATGFIHDTVTNHATEPFFLTLAHYAVHTPVEAKKSDVDYFQAQKVSRAAELATHPQAGEALVKDYSSATRLTQDNSVYAAMMKSYDDSLASLRSYLAATDDPRYPGEKLSETTVIVVSSDHGGKSTTAYGSGSSPSKELEDDATDTAVTSGAIAESIGFGNEYSNYPTSNYPFRQGKTWVYEGGLKIPLIVYFPGVTQEGAVSNAFAHGADFAASFCDIAGVMPDAQFRDSESFLLPAALPRRTARKEQFHFFTNASTGTANPALASYRDGDYKLLYFMIQRRAELYHLGADLYEQNDLSASRPELVAEMLEKVYQQHLATGAKMPKPGSNSWRSEQEVLVDNGVIAALPSPPDAAPTGLTLTQLSETAIQLDWTVNASNATHSVIYRSGVDERGFNGGSDSYREVAYVPAAQTTWVDSSFTSAVGEKYKYRVESENLAGWNGAALDSSGLFSTQVTNNGSTNTGNVTLTLVSGGTRALVASDDVVTASPGELRVFDPTLNDTGEGGLLITSITQPTDGCAWTDGEVIYFAADEAFAGGLTLTYTLTDAASQTDSATVNLSLPLQASSAVLECWDFAEAVGTKLADTVSSGAASFSGDSGAIQTNGAGELVLRQDTSDSFRVAQTLSGGPYSGGRFELSFLVSEVNLAGSSSGAGFGFTFRDQAGGGKNFGTFRIRNNNGDLVVENRVANSNEQLYHLGAASAVYSDLLLKMVLDLEADTLSHSLTIGGGSEIELAVLASDPAAVSLDSIRFQGNVSAPNWGAADTVKIETLKVSRLLNGSKVYDVWASTFPWNGSLAQGRNEDPDGDGHLNLLEFALGQNPLLADFDKMPNVGPGPAFRFTPVRDPASLHYRVEFSEDLSVWDAFEVFDVATGAGVPVAASFPTDEQGFGRLVVSEK